MASRDNRRGLREMMSLKEKQALKDHFIKALQESYTAVNIITRITRDGLRYSFDSKGGIEGVRGFVRWQAFPLADLNPLDLPTR